LNPDWLYLVLRPFADKQRRMAALSCAAAASEVTSQPRLRQAQRACTSASSLAALHSQQRRVDVFIFAEWMFSSTIDDQTRPDQRPEPSVSAELSDVSSFGFPL